MGAGGAAAPPLNGPGSHSVLPPVGAASFARNARYKPGISPGNTASLAPLRAPQKELPPVQPRFGAGGNGASTRHRATPREEEERGA